MDLCMRIAADLILQKISEGSSSNIVMSPMSITVVLNLVAAGSHGETLAQFLKVLGSKDTQELNSVSEQILSLFSPTAPADNEAPSPPLPPLPPCPTPETAGFSFDRMPGSYRPLLFPFGPSPPPPLPLRENYFRFGMPENPKVSVPKKGKEPMFTMANSLWVDHECPLKSSFERVADSVYKALVKNGDLANQGEKVKAEVNAWTERNTNGLIKELLSKQVKLGTSLCLASALYFKGTWESPFRVSNTRDDEFHLLNGQTTKVPFMIIQYKDYGYASFDDFKLLRLPYERGQSTNKKFSMYFFLPHARDGLKGLVEKLKSDPATFRPKMFSLPSTELLKVWIPKLEFSTDFDVIDLMKSEGLALPFDPSRADFTNMVRGGDVHVDMFLHKAYIKVNEEGTEVVAMTFCGFSAFGCCAAMPSRVLPSFVADHPFLFMIVEDVSSHVVFSGAVLNPLSK